MTSKSTAVKLTLKVTSFVVRLLLNIIFYIIIVILIINVSKKAFEFTYQIYGPDTVDAPPGRDIIIQIKKGDSNMDIAGKLEINRVIENKYSFFVKTKLQEFVIMPGTYVVNSSMTYDDILTVITDSSKSIVQEEDTGTGSDNDTSGGNSKNTDTGSKANTEGESSE